MSTIPRQPVHDFDIRIHDKGNGVFEATLAPPSGFDRPHLGNINILKAVEEAAVAINTNQGLEDESTGFTGKKLLASVELRMMKEVTDFSNLTIRLRIVSQRKIGNKLWQFWEFWLNKAFNGKMTLCYVYIPQN